MIRTTAVPRPLRAGAAVLGVAGMIALAGCSATDTASTSATGGTADTGGAGTTGSSTPSGAGAQGSAGSADGTSTYADGTYTAAGSYATPESVEQITVTVTLQDDVITDVEVTGNPTKRESQEYQSRFIGGIADVVVGQDIDSISVSRVAGSSLTSGGFNQAIDEIKAEAAA
ncbi:FMN-binding protein [Microbacterium sp. BK668]|uniref:FMN-binding protein n=1 Tax=Microbacterium sp. BK668 TaxID=2512118 RepID=UPI00105D1953|nr:FMN-binding protein [Microbacterium sp. BK668]TDN92359.1 FMN-binding protein [Microbacterium sp. BK668]